MLILAIDTSGKHGSVTLARGGEADCRVIETVPIAGGTFSAQLIPQIAELLKRHGLGKKAIDALACASGPGSFTGLRVGLTAIKALAEILSKPIAAVSMLEACAAKLNLAEGMRIFPVLDAQRGEFFVGDYTKTNGVLVRAGESLMSRD